MAAPPVAQLEIRDQGSGPDLVLVHGGAGPVATWGALLPMAARRRLRLVHRRGYGASPEPAGGRQDFEIDAADLAAVLAQGGPPDLAAHSYGCHAALLATAADPGSVRSLTVIEPPLYFLNPGDPDVEALKEMGDEMITEGEHADPARLRAFLRIAGVEVDDGPLPEPVLAGVRRAHGGRVPSESRPHLDSIRAAGVPCLVASGDHEPGLEKMCDALAERLDAERLRCPGAGHFVAAAPGFAAALEAFLEGR